MLDIYLYGPSALWAFAIALAVSGVAAWPTFKLLLAIKSRQTVSQYLGETHQVKQGTPTMGGLILLPGFLVGCLVEGTLRHYWALFVGYALIGFLDDFVVPRLWPAKRGLGWTPKLVLQIGIGWFCLPRWGDWAHDAVTLFVILFVANAYNFADGLDGLAAGLLLILGTALALIGLAIPSVAPAVACAALCGAVLPFLYFNKPPARLFMGDVGSLPIGAVLGAVLVGELQVHQGTPVITALWYGAFAILSLVLIAELVPVPLQILSVKLRKGKRLFPRTPIHHTFEHWGWPESKITRLFLLVQLACALVALWLSSFGGDCF